jgi:hypothetical protein
MSRRFVILTLVLLLGGRDAVALAQGTEWQFSYESARPVRLPAWLRTDSLRAALSYDLDSTEVVAGFVADINRDGVQDYVFRFSRTACGTNCEYALIDGRTHREVGRLGGTVVVVRPRVINGYPVIESYGHSSVDAGYWSTAVFDGGTYVTVASHYIEGSSRQQFFDALRAIPAWPPPR